MRIATELTRRFDLSCPVIQAPMAGGGDTPQLAAAVSNAGALGFVGAAYLTPEQIVERGCQVRSLTTRPFGVNLFAPQARPGVDLERIAKAVDRIRVYHAELGLAAPQLAEQTPPDFREQLEAALETGAQMFSFTLGLLSGKVIAEIQQRGVFVAGTATTVDEAKMLLEAGVDAVIAQGSEAGGHRGTFSTDFESGAIGSLSLIPQIADAIPIPVIASGGIMDGRGITAALSLGASAVQMGTAFLNCPESGASQAYKKALLEASEDETRMTRAFSGRPARGIRNRLSRDYEGATEEILPFPLQNALTRPLRTEAARQNRAEYLSLWAGQGLRMVRAIPASELIWRFNDEIALAMQSLLETIQTGK